MTPLINGSTQKYGIIGNPVSHSFSPLMHTTAFQTIGFNGVYLPFLINEPQLPGLLPAFTLLGIQGFNVTVPFKEKIIPFLDQLTEEAQSLGSVNTVWQDQGRWFGHSTDGAGFIRGLEEAGWEVDGKRVLLLGAGGSAKAVAFALLKAGAAKVDVNNRTESKAQALVNKLWESFDSSRIGMERVGDYDLLVNCTSVGLKGDQSPICKNELPKFKKVIDIIYNPAQTRLLLEAKALGIPTKNGLSMLLYQGVESFELWTKQPAPVGAMATVLQQHWEPN